MELSRNQLFVSRPLLHLGFGVFLPLLVFIVLASHVWNHGNGFVWDIPVLQWVHQTAQPILDTIALTVSPLGTKRGAFPVLVVIGAVLLYRRNWRSLLYLVVTPLGSKILNRTLKLFFQRERPHLWDAVSSKLSYAFPSGHAMFSASVVIVLIVLAWNTRWRWVVFSTGSLFTLTVGWTRIYLGKHYPSDVLAGWMLAIAWSIALMFVIQPQKTSRTEPEVSLESSTPYTKGT